MNARRALSSVLLAAAVACRDGDLRFDDPSVPRVSRATPADGVAWGWSDEATYVRTITGFDGPESVKYDPEQDVWFVSNQTGPGSEKDGNGYIVRVSAANPDVASVLIQGGIGGAVLDSPKGLALHGDTLWATDIDKLRAFDRHTGTPLATIDFAGQGAVQLNDIAVAPDGTLRVTDTGILMSRKGVKHLGPDRIFVVGPGRAISTMVQGPELHWPNGITWDAAHRRWIVVSFDPFGGEVAAYPEHGGARQLLHRTDRGNLDGVEVLPDGTLLFASWTDSTIYAMRDGAPRRLVHEVPEPADIGIDTRRNLLLIPMATLGRVEVWRMR